MPDTVQEGDKTTQIIFRRGEPFKAPPEAAHRDTPEVLEEKAAVRAACRSGAFHSQNLDQIEWVINRYAPDLMPKWRAARHSIRKHRRDGDVFLGEYSFDPRDVSKVYSGGENRKYMNYRDTLFITFAMNPKLARTWLFKKMV